MAPGRLPTARAPAPGTQLPVRREPARHLEPVPWQGSHRGHAREWPGLDGTVQATCAPFSAARPAHAADPGASHGFPPRRQTAHRGRAMPGRHGACLAGGATLGQWPSALTVVLPWVQSTRTQAPRVRGSAAGMHGHQNACPWEQCASTSLRLTPPPPPPPPGERGAWHREPAKKHPRGRVQAARLGTLESTCKCEQTGANCSQATGPDARPRSPPANVGRPAPARRLHPSTWDPCVGLAHVWAHMHACRDILMRLQAQAAPPGGGSSSGGDGRAAQAARGRSRVRRSRRLH